MIDYQYYHKLAIACSLAAIPCSRRIFESRLKIMSTYVKNRISTMGNLFVAEDLVEQSIIAIHYSHKSKR
jgi:hypothetical protein